VYRSLVQRIFGIPLLYKVLLANGIIVVLGATVGTLITVRSVNGGNDPAEYWLIAIFAIAGTVLSLVVNYLVLRAALQPIDRLTEVAERVRTGDFTRRVRPSRFPDPQLARLGTSFNETLDELAADRHQLRQLTTQVINAQEDERKRIARELHDDTAQVLFAQLLGITALRASDNDQVRAAAESMAESTVDAIEGVRRLALELRPPALDDLGLWAALGELAQRFDEKYGLEVGYAWHGPRERLPADLELVLYRIAQEAMTNVIKHARATRATIEVERRSGEVVLTVSDNGRGFEPTRPAVRDERELGLGIFGMVERTALVGGGLRIEPVDPHGVAIVAIIPLAHAVRIMNYPLAGVVPNPRAERGQVDGTE
jgi:two-component system sensor histidine kinase UhpB